MQINFSIIIVYRCQLTKIVIININYLILKIKWKPIKYKKNKNILI